MKGGGAVVVDVEMTRYRPRYQMKLACLTVNMFEKCQRVYHLFKSKRKEIKLLIRTVIVSYCITWGGA